MSELYEVLDPRPNAAEAPYTFFLPDADLIKAVRIGDHVKAIIRAVPPSKTYDAERMWIQVSSAEPDWIEGTLDSEPRDMPNLRLGTPMRLPRSYIIEVALADPSRTPHSVKPKRQYWDRCMVDQCVIDGELAVGYLYREPPDLTKEGDKFPDSGWRIRGDMRGSLIEQADSRKVAYVALGLVLNADDSWLHLIDEPVGASFGKDFEKGVFVRSK
jgi:hypothetical protein